MTVTDPSGQLHRVPLQPGQAPDAAHWTDDDVCGHTHDLWLCTRHPHAGDPHHEASGKWTVHAVWTGSASGGVSDYRVDGE